MASSVFRTRTPTELSGTPIQVGYQSASPWRAVIWRPEVVIRGPSNMPALIASRTPTVVRPVEAGSAIEV